MGLRKGEKTGVGGVSLMGFPDPSVHRTRRKSSSVADNSETHFHCARAGALSNIEPHGSIITSDRLEEQNRHREGTVITNMDLEESVNDLLQLMYLLILFIYACLIPNRFLFSLPNDRG